MTPRSVSILAAAGFKRIWAIDFEYGQSDLLLPVVRCLVAKDLVSGVVLRQRYRESEKPPCPFKLDGRELFISYSATAEASSFLALNWPPPLRMLDLLPVYIAARNGEMDFVLKNDTGLLSALVHYGLPALSVDEKNAMLELAMIGPKIDEEWVKLVDYCEGDVDALILLLDPLCEAADLGDPLKLARALRWGRYMSALATIMAVGTPLRGASWQRIEAKWPEIKLAWVERLDRYGVYEGVSFRQELFGRYLERLGRLECWPRTEKSNLLATDKKTFSSMVDMFPDMRELYELKKAMDGMRSSALEIGADGRNRVWFGPFLTKTGRNAPKAAPFIFGPAKWVRNLIQPPKGHAVFYSDFGAQEVGIAARLSGDEVLKNDYFSDDFYISMAVRRLGLAPPGATKKSHPEIRVRCKPITLGINYGMSAGGLARRLGVSLNEAREILQNCAWPTRHSLRGRTIARRKRWRARP
jgi:hypothetical protein